MKYFLAYILFIVIAATPSFALAKSIGKIIAIEGSASITHQNTTKAISDNSLVHLNDIIETEKNSKLVVLFEDNTQFTISENASLKIDEYVFDSQEKTNNKASFSVLKGAFLLTTGLISKKETPDVTINTPQGSIGIRGTVVWGGMLDNQYGVLVRLGEAEIYNQHGSVTLYPGEGAYLPEGENSPRKIGGWPDEMVSKALRITRMKNLNAINKLIATEKENNKQEW